MNVYSFKTLETFFYVGADDLTDALVTANEHLREIFANEPNRAEYNQIGDIHLVAGNILISGKSLKS